MKAPTPLRPRFTGYSAIGNYAETGLQIAEESLALQKILIDEVRESNRLKRQISAALLAWARWSLIPAGDNPKPVESLVADLEKALGP